MAGKGIEATEVFATLTHEGLIVEELGDGIVATLDVRIDRLDL